MIMVNVDAKQEIAERMNLTEFIFFLLPSLEN